MQDDFFPNLYKNILVSLWQGSNTKVIETFSDSKNDILTTFCRLISHSHIKMYVYSIIVKTLEDKKVRYRIREKEHKPNKVIFTIIQEQRKTKIADFEVMSNNVFSTAYTHLCIGNFVPLCPRKKIMCREIRSIIENTLEIQEEYLNILKSD